MLPDRDRYSGWVRVKSEATGFFRVEHIGQRWWFVTPEGHGFISTGMNHLYDDFFRCSKNRDHWAAMLADPAEYARRVIGDHRELNMTAMGYGFPYDKPGFPHVRNLKLIDPSPSTWREVQEFPDLFDDAFPDRFMRVARSVCGPSREDPWLIGYLLNDCLEWPILGHASKRRLVNWIDAIKQKGPVSPGKRAYVGLIKERHRQIRSFNAAYGTEFVSFDELLGAGDFVLNVPPDPEAVRADDEAFLSKLASRYYDMAVDAIRRVDTHHLILGDIFDGNRGFAAPVIHIAKEHCDIIATQYYGIFKDQVGALEDLHAATGLPILLADSCYSKATDELPRSCGPRLPTHEARANAFEIYARQALSRPYILGWHWCGYVDGSVEFEPAH
jgi:hypothetical protein